MGERNRANDDYDETPAPINEKEPLLEEKDASVNPKFCTLVNREYLPSKIFFFLYFAANGTLMPYLVLYFKQLRLTPSQVGVVSGTKPFIAFVFVPVWGLIADRTKRARLIYVMSMLFYLCGYFSYSLAPAKHVCMLKSNSTKHAIMYPMSMHNHGRRQLDHPPNVSLSNPGLMQIRPIANHQFHGRSSSSSSEVKNFLSSSSGLASQEDYGSISLPKSWTTAGVVYEHPWTLSASAKMSLLDGTAYQEMDDVHVDVSTIFTYLLIVTITSTVFSCPALTIVDTATIRKLKENKETHLYGKQRLWGSLGWGLSAFSVGAILSLLPLCPGKNNEINYYPMFYIFGLLLATALVAGLKLTYVDAEEVSDNGLEKEISLTQSQISIVIGLIKKPKYVAFVITAFFTGVVMSVIRTFLFWHLKDIGGTQILFSIIPALNCSAEVFMYFYSSTFIQKVGHIRVLYIALLCYAIRLFYYGLLTNPWFALAVEPFSGITTAAAWASMTSYVGVNSPPKAATTMQGILHGVHWGLGHGCGELLGGFVVTWLGASHTFLLFGLASILNLLMFILVNKSTEQCCPDKDQVTLKLQDESPLHKTSSCH